MEKTKVPKTVELKLTKKQLELMKPILDFAEKETRLGRSGAIISQLFHDDSFHVRGEVKIGFVTEIYTAKLKKVFRAYHKTVDPIL